MVIRIIKKGNTKTVPEIKPAFDGVEVVKDGVTHAFMGKTGDVEVTVAKKLPKIKKVKKVVKKKKKAVRKYPLTDRQRKVVALVGQGRKSRAAILREAGYAPSIVDHPNRVFDKPEVAKAVDSVVDRLVRHRDRILELMEQKVGTAGYSSLSMTLDSITKQVELLSNRPTSREEYKIAPERKAKLKELLKMNS